MKVIGAPRAIERAAQIAAAIAADHPLAARGWVDDLFAAVSTLAAHPKRGRRVPELDRPDIREIIQGPYRVVYRVDPKRLVILTIRPGRRAWDSGDVEAE